MNVIKHADFSMLEGNFVSDFLKLILGRLTTKKKQKTTCIQNRLLVFPPDPKKGMVRLLKKGHFLTRGNMSKGHFQRATTGKRALLSGPWHARRAH